MNRTTTTLSFVSILLGCFCPYVAAQPAPCPAVSAATGQPGWTLMGGPGVTTPKTPVNVTPVAGWGLLPGSNWISVSSDRGNLAGDYAFEFQFNSCPCNDGEASALALSFLADNGATVYMNGAPIFSTTGDKNFTGAPLNVNYTGKFATGANKLRIVVHNEGSVTGLDAVVRIKGATTGACPSCGANLAAATGQPGWTLVSGPGVGSPKAPVSVTPHAGWGLLPGSGWVSVDAKGGSLSGDYRYEYNFCKCGPGALSLQMFADNGATVSLNNKDIFSSSGDGNFKGTPMSVNYNGPFATGANKLDVVVHNGGNVTGLDAILKMAGATAGSCAR